MTPTATVNKKYRLMKPHTKGLYTSVPFTQCIVSGFERQQNARHAKNKNPNCRVRVPDSHERNLSVITGVSEVILTNMLRVFVEKETTYKNRRVM